MKNTSLKLFIALFALIGVMSCKKSDTTTAAGPVAAFTSIVSDTSYLVAFSSINSGDPKSWTWDFGDGQKGTGEVASHNYATSGDYQVTLTVSNNNGSKSITNKVTVFEKVIKISTSFGDMYMWLYTQTPHHRSNYLKLAQKHFYDGTTFHRIVKNFVIQGGDSLSKDQDTTNDGTGGPSTLYPEIMSTIKHDYGAVGAARNGNPQKISNNWQFYIVTNTAGDHTLDGNYTVFGTIIKGMDVANTIQNQANNPTNNRPYKNITMNVSILQMSKADILSQYGYTVK